RNNTTRKYAHGNKMIIATWQVTCVLASISSLPPCGGRDREGVFDNACRDTPLPTASRSTSPTTGELSRASCESLASLGPRDDEERDQHEPERGQDRGRCQENRRRTQAHPRQASRVRCRRRAA